MELVSLFVLLLKEIHVFVLLHFLLDVLLVEFPPDLNQVVVVEIGVDVDYEGGGDEVDQVERGKTDIYEPPYIKEQLVLLAWVIFICDLESLELGVDDRVEDVLEEVGHRHDEEEHGQGGELSVAVSQSISKVLYSIVRCCCTLEGGCGRTALS